MPIIWISEISADINPKYIQSNVNICVKILEFGFWYFSDTCPMFIRVMNGYNV